MIDFIASIPYRIFGIILFIFALIVSIPFVVLPLIFSMITNGTTIQEARANGELILGSTTIQEALDIFKDSGIFTLWTCSILIKFALRGWCMLIFGINYDEALIEVLNSRISND